MKLLLNLIVAVTIALFATNSSAQTFGVKGGLNMSTMFFKTDGDKVDFDQKMNPGFHIGPTMELAFSEMFSLQTELMLSTKGFKDNVTITDEMGNVIGMFDYKMNLYYIDIPLSAKVKVNFNRFRLFGTIGPSLGIGIKGKGKYEVGDEKETNTIKFGPDEIFRRLDFGLTFGGGIEINCFLFGLNYNLGLTNIIHGDYVKEKNRVLSLSVGYRFGKREKQVVSKE